MRVIRIQRDRIFLGLAGVLILSQLCLGLNDTKGVNFLSKSINSSLSAITNPRNYFVSELAPLFVNWTKNKDNNIEKRINEVFRNLAIDAHLVKNSIQFNNGSFEFLVYVNKYKRSFVVKYTPLVNDLNLLVENEEFRLEIRIFSAWRNLPLDRLFG